MINETVQTTIHAHTVEGLKDNLYRRLDSLRQDKANWTKHIDNIIKMQNSIGHSVTQIKPTEAGDKENHLWVNWHLQNNAKSNGKYTEIKAGDMVRVHVKPKLGAKGHEPKWSSTRHKVIGNPTNQYFIPSIHKSKMWLRHGLLKV